MAWIALWGSSSQKLTATARCARRSEVSDTTGDPVNRQTTITLASASMPLPSAQRGSWHFRRRMSARFPPGTFPGSMSYPAVRRSLYW